MAETRWRLSLLLAALGFFSLTAHGYIENTDIEVTLHAADAWWRRGEPRLIANAPDSTAAETAITNLFIAHGSFGMPAGDGHGAYIWFPIGHQALLVPAVAAGEWLDSVFPTPAARWRETRSPGYGGVHGGLYGARFLGSFISPWFAGLGLLAVVSLARSAGRSRRDAILVGVLATVATQYWPGSAETMSDMPGGALFLIATACVASSRRKSNVSLALIGGAVAGCAVLVRYPLALGVIALLALMLFDVLRSRAARSEAFRRLVCFGVGGAPLAALLLVANHWRFGSVFETGYSAGANSAWWSYPVWLGASLVMIAPGKGLLLFSPLLLLACGRLRHRAVRTSPLVVAGAAMLIVTVLQTGMTAGWDAGQCYGIRYLTPSAVLFLVATLIAGPRLNPLFPPTLGLVALAFVVGMGGVVTQYTTHHKLATRAAATMFPESPDSQLPEHVNFQPRITPLHGHWSYAYRAATGQVDQWTSESTTEPMYGLETTGLPHPAFEDTGFRHLWWRHRDGLTGGLSATVAALVLAVGTALLGRAAWRWASAKRGLENVVSTPRDEL